ncbi:DeoR/GlpR family DNA-binding transcription regulator [Arthrobacter woluwensis]|uniref:DeoR/GlpR family DNA-binding transcription regulator n=1 Tax=Arthrobacter woluwensis TaxID=156980 RepID=UPI001AB019A2|nr:DeoR/GlpR family DNA-binding transcription regulator [Arthrobacter woluwensis]QTF72799.1 DeoR/GlpR transcriptional regulator [Arthrobacter woluwensis]
MEPQERQARILDLAREQGKVEVASLVPALGAAAETVRRDLRALVDRGVLRRVHGGAVAVETAGFESDTGYRATANVAEKRRIAAAAAELLHGAETVFLDEGFTPRLIAEQLRDARRLTVVTASLLAAQALSRSPGVTVLLLGGRMRGHTLATVDHWALRMLGELQIDVAFLGANGISREHGLTTPDPAVAAIKQEAVRQSRRRILVGTHTKFGVTSFCRFATVQDFETIVTDGALSAHEAQRYETLGPRVLRV